MSLDITYLLSNHLNKSILLHLSEQKGKYLSRLSIFF